MTPLIPAATLHKSEKILFVAHLALGDFTYMQNGFRAFAAAYPHIAIHLWIDEVRRTSDQTQWEGLRNYSLYDWVEQSGLFSKVYRKTYSPALYQESIHEAQAEDYPVIVSLAHIRAPRYADLAREIGPNSRIIGIRKPVTLLRPLRYFSYRKLDATFSPYSAADVGRHHISSVYADWFHQLTGLEIPVAERYPFVHIPDSALQQAKAQLREWGVDTQTTPLVLLNPFAKSHKRAWPLERITELIARMQQQPQWRHACFLVNAMPQELASVNAAIAAAGVAQTRAFSAVDNFFQLPAMLAQCNLIISVETSIMHLANAVHVPVIALMRKKNPEWAPFDSASSTIITVARRSDWVKAISVEQVLQALPARTT
ncbi:lipopolysaccharide heptosyltransferase family protein [Janthinobacterium aquaticum]|nr:lipopolysaccharide heptosyltransferase family protein [Janthinobacterium sp. FT58W]